MIGISESSLIYEVVSASDFATRFHSWSSYGETGAKLDTVCESSPTRPQRTSDLSSGIQLFSGRNEMRALSDQSQRLRLSWRSYYYVHDVVKFNK